VKFGEVVRLAKETCKDPVALGVERVIGLEHLEAGDLRVRSWAEIADGTTFTTRVRPGQVLFGKRRAYQRKVAVAEFDAVCSGDIYVFESTSPDRLLPELLPFVCQTEAFFEYAVGTSAGSLSPRTNWSSLAEYEFALPPPHEQQEIVRALTNAELAISASRELERAATSVLLASLLDWEKRCPQRRPLQELCRSPVTYGIVKAGLHVHEGVPYVRVTDITAGPRLTSSKMLKTSDEVSRSYARTILENGDSIIAVKAARGVVGQARRVAAELVGGNISRDVARAAPCPDIDAGYLYWALRMPSFMAGVQARETGWKGDSLREITIGALRTVPVTWMPPSQQRNFAQTLDVIEEATVSAARRVAEMCAIRASVLANVMRGPA
jgi:type I restriction enzyme S subunit